MSFSTLGLTPELLRAVSDAGYTEPSPIQAKAIPACLEGRDVLAAAQTGTGKTAGFTLPILQRLSARAYTRNRPVRALILAPTRELAAQVHASVEQYGQYLNPKLKSEVVFGGVKINPQIARLRDGVDVLVACPGRLLDLVGQRAVRLDQVETLVLDEADRMLDMGFLRDIKRVLALLPAKRQNLLFSATFSKEIRTLTQSILTDPVTIEVAARNAAAESVAQAVYKVPKPAKSALLIHLIKQHAWKQVLVFTATKHMANRVTQRLERAGISAAAIHGNKSQNARTSALAGFKSGSVEVLVATDVAARGIDISQLPNVINFELPNVPADYVHRIGRTGRAGASGQAVSLVSPDEHDQLRQIERLISKPIEVVAARDFDPSSVVVEQEPERPPRQPRGQGRRGASSSAARGGAESRSGGNSEAEHRRRRSAPRAQNGNR